MAATPASAVALTLCGRLRVARAAVLGGAAVALAAAAHGGAGGALPSWPVLALLSVPVAWLCVLLTRRTLGPVVLLTALGIVQVGLHTAFMALASGGCARMSSGGSMTSTHGAHLPPTAAAGCSAHGAMSMSGSGWMTLAHSVATVATALLLARAERVLLSLVGLLLGALDRVATPPVAVRALPPLRPVGHRAPGWRRPPALRNQHRRGPPARACAAPF